MRGPISWFGLEALSRQAIDDLMVLRIAFPQNLAICQFEVGEIEAGSNGTAD